MSKLFDRRCHCTVAQSAHGRNRGQHDVPSPV